MVLVTVNNPKRLLYLSFIGRVSAAELEGEHKDVVSLLQELTSGFRLLADLSHLDSFDLDASREIARVMDLCADKGVGLVVRIIPDPRKDIGLNILSRFHYHNRPRIVTCASFAEAGKVLGFERAEKASM